MEFRYHDILGGMMHEKNIKLQIHSDVDQRLLDLVTARGDRDKFLKHERRITCDGIAQELEKELDRFSEVREDYMFRHETVQMYVLSEADMEDLVARILTEERSRR